MTRKGDPENTTATRWVAMALSGAETDNSADPICQTVFFLSAESGRNYRTKPTEISTMPDCVPPDTTRSGAGGGVLPRGS